MKPHRRLVRTRANGRCEYCRLPEALSGAAFHVEHIVPRSRGGKDVEFNLALACPRCNERKGTKTVSVDPTTGMPARLFHPRRDSWNRHFQWSSDRLTLLGKTSVGRATLQALDLNSSVRKRLRAIWRDRLADLFPFD